MKQDAKTKRHGNNLYIDVECGKLNYIISELRETAKALIEKVPKSGRYYDDCVQYWCAVRGEYDIRREFCKGFEQILDLQENSE